MNLVIDVTEL